MLVYKIDVLETLKEAGYNTTKLRKKKYIFTGDQEDNFIRTDISF